MSKAAAPPHPSLCHCLPTAHRLNPANSQGCGYSALGSFLLHGVIEAGGTFSKRWDMLARGQSSGFSSGGGVGSGSSGFFEPEPRGFFFLLAGSGEDLNSSEDLGFGGGVAAVWSLSNSASFFFAASEALE